MLTKRQALEECIKMWDWLAENPEDDKEQYMLRVRKIRYRRRDNRINPHYPVHSCYACHYALEQEYGRARGGLLDSTACRHCPVWHQPHPNADFMCLHPGSPFKMWDDYFDYLVDPSAEEINNFRIKNARKVADMARRRLAALDITG